MSNMPPTVPQSLWATLVSLKNALQAANKLVPCTIPVIIFLTMVVFYVSFISTSLMIGIVALVVLIGSIFVYFNNKNYADAAVSLTVGLLTALTVGWTGGRFLLFIIFWSVFLCIVLLASSIKIAERVEFIYTEAVVSIGASNIESMRTQLQQIGRETDINMLGPVEKAEIIRLFAFRKLPVNIMKSGLQRAALLATVTQVSYLPMAAFVADIYRLSQTISNADYERLLSDAQQIIRECPVSPSEVIDAYNASRRIVLSGKMNVDAYFDKLRNAIVQGVPPEEVVDYIQE